MADRKRSGGDFCSAVCCSNARNKRSCAGKSFFRFPRDAERCRKWIQNLRREDLLGVTPEVLHFRAYKLCSDHFEDSQFTCVAEKQRLVWNAVPTLFSVPDPPPHATAERKQMNKTSASCKPEELLLKETQISADEKSSTLDDSTLMMSIDEAVMSEVKMEKDIAEETTESWIKQEPEDTDGKPSRLDGSTMMMSSGVKIELEIAEEEMCIAEETTESWIKQELEDNTSQMRRLPPGVQGLGLGSVMSMSSRPPSDSEDGRTMSVNTMSADTERLPVPSSSDKACSPFDGDDEPMVESVGEDSDGSTVYPVLQYSQIYAQLGFQNKSNVLVGKEQGSSADEGNKKDQIRKGGKRKSKKHCCKFCKKEKTKMSTHLMRAHKCEPEVAAVLAIEKGSPRRRAAFIAIQDEGDFQHNLRVLKDKEGCLIPKYRKSSGTRKDSNYLACPHCKAIFLKTRLSKHEKRCKRKPDGKVMKRGQCAVLGKMILPLPSEMMTSFFEKVISKMRDDEVSSLVQHDSLIIKYGERLFSRHDIEEHSYGHISSCLRELGRLCQLLRKKSQMHIISLTEAINPVHFDQLVAAVKELGKFNQSTNLCSKWTLVLRLGYSLKKCSQILKAEAIKNNDHDSKDRCERFEALYASDWFDRISACAPRSVQRERMNRQKLLPSIADVEKVTALLEKDSHSLSYPTLAKATLAAITIFNRKRGGEVQRMKCSDYRKSKESSTSRPEVLANLTITEKKLVERLHRVEIRRKSNRAVPVLLTPKMVQNIEKLLELRSQSGLDSDYLFITPSGDRPYRGSTALKEYAAAAQVANLDLFTAAHLHKQLATLSQAMEISKLGQDQLAQFLGHDIRIHKNIYHQTAKVASVLLKVNKGVEITADCCDAVEEEDLEPEEASQEEKATSETSDEEVDDCGTESERQHDAKDTLVSTRDIGSAEQRTENESARPPAHTTKKKPARQIRKKTPWTKDEVAGVHKHLSRCITSNRCPQKHDCEQALAMEPALRNRTWKDVKYYVYNLLKKRQL